MLHSLVVEVKDRFRRVLSQPIRVYHARVLNTDVEIMTCKIGDDRHFVSSLALCEVPIPYQIEVDGKAVTPRIECVIVINIGGPQAFNICAHIAVFMASNPEATTVGTVLQNVFRTHIPATTTPHALIIAPFGSESQLNQLEPLSDGTYLYWVRAAPLTDAELHYYEKNGYNALFGLFEAARVNSEDLYRTSAC